MRYVKGSPTSRAAAIDNWPRAGTQKAKILQFLKDSGDATREEIENYCGLSGNAVRPRVAELIEAGLVEETDGQRRNRSGSMAFVLTATNVGGSTEGGKRVPGISRDPSASQSAIGVASGVEARTSTSPPPVPGEDVAGSARPLNPYEFEVMEGAA